MNSITFFLCFIPILALILLGLNLVFAPHSPYQEKSSTFECGFHSFLGQNRTQFSISFFIYALLFLLFDLELLVIYPYVVSSYTNAGLGLSVMLIFFTILTIGFAFEIGKKALNIDSRQNIKDSSYYSNELKNSLLINEVFILLFNELHILTKGYVKEFNLTKLIIGVSCTRIVLLFISIFLYEINTIEYDSIWPTTSWILFIYILIILILTPGDKVPKFLSKLLGNCIVASILLLLIYTIFPYAITIKFFSMIPLVSFDMFDLGIIKMDPSIDPKTGSHYSWHTPGGPPNGPPGPGENKAWCLAWKNYEDNQKHTYDQWSGNKETYREAFEKHKNNELVKSEAEEFMQLLQPNDNYYKAAQSKGEITERFHVFPTHSKALSKDLLWVLKTFYPEDLMTKPIHPSIKINNFLMWEAITHIEKEGDHKAFKLSFDSTEKDIRKTYNALKLRNEAVKEIQKNWSITPQSPPRDLSPPRMLPYIPKR